jgi:hypothetical protein
VAFWFQSFLAVLLRPWLWATALAQMCRMAPSRWWSRSPYLPLPDRGYLEFRLETAYGARGTPRAVDVVRYLEWCRSARAGSTGRRAA